MVQTVALLKYSITCSADFSNHFEEFLHNRVLIMATGVMTFHFTSYIFIVAQFNKPSAFKMVHVKRDKIRIFLTFR